MTAKQPSDQHRWRMRMFLLHGAMLGAPAALLGAHTYFPVNAPSICVFKALAGIDCPACGITHSVMALFAGHMGDAFRIHPAGPVVVGVIGIMTVYLALVLFSRYKGWGWKKEAQAYTILERLAIGVLLMGWVGKRFIN
ncbi:MAG: DUF2752 domain-containing protein [bacterium]